MNENQMDLSGINSAKRGTPEHEAFVERLEELANNVSGGNFCADYSGRCMYGKTCLSVDADNEIEALMEAGRLGLPRPKMDSMGMGIVLYWAGIEGEET